MKTGIGGGRRPGTGMVHVATAKVQKVITIIAITTVHAQTANGGEKEWERRMRTCEESQPASAAKKDFVTMRPMPDGSIYADAGPPLPLSITAQIK